MSELQDRLHYDEEFRILYLKNKINGSYEPIMYDCVETSDSYDGKKIEKDSIFHYLIKFVRRLSTEINKKTGAKILLPKKDFPLCLAIAIIISWFFNRMAALTITIAKFH